MRPVSAVIVAAGAGRRFGGMKQYAALGGQAVLSRTVEAFENHPEVDTIVLVVAGGKERDLSREKYRKISGVVPGGERRQDSVRRGFAALSPEGEGIVLVHDGARPLVSRDVITRIIAAAGSRGAAIPVVPVGDTVKEVRGGQVVRTVDRALLFRAQTPQGFLYAVLREILGGAEKAGFSGTDEAVLAERMGIPVEAVEGDPRNIKITTPLDLAMAEGIIDA